ncbi:9106_t:CDS:1 [Paraglomus occultum]|uniref:9106_t:CDS:1 n=1 Tax=Paraglomus occultum TaxID=144539 RepID=A0A9N9AYZ7_9GLOM|nr:9106_t:CDS:1 [Paraglomus occultum]
MTSTSSTPLSKQSNPRQRRNTLSIIIHATMQLLSSPPTSPTHSTVDGAILSQSSMSSTSSRDDSSEYFSFPDYETYIKDVEETEKMVVQMEEFDEMVVNGVRIRSPKN